MTGQLHRIAPRKPQVTLDDLRNGPPVVDIATASKLLGISRSYGYELAKQEVFPAKVLTVGRHLRVVTASLIALLDADEQDVG